MPECPECGFPYTPGKEDNCLKCGREISQHALLPLLHIDIAHRGESWEEAKRKLDTAIDEAYNNYHSGLKVVHGYGSSNLGESVIAPRAKSYMKHIAEELGGRFTADKYNPGASILWLNR